MSQKLSRIFDHTDFPAKSKLCIETFFAQVRTISMRWVGTGPRKKREGRTPTRNSFSAVTVLGRDGFAVIKMSLPLPTLHRQSSSLTLHCQIFGNVHWIRSVQFKLPVKKLIYDRKIVDQSSFYKMFTNSISLWYNHINEALGIYVNDIFISLAT